MLMKIESLTKNYYENKKKVESIDTVFFIGSSLTLGYGANLIWEYLQCLPFFQHLQSLPTPKFMLVAALGDVMMMALVYLGTAIATNSAYWFNEKWSLKLVFLIVCLSIFLAVIVEVLALKTSRWAYTSKNPIIPLIGISILPIIQMILINPIVFYVSKKTAFAFRKFGQPTTEII